MNRSKRIICFLLITTHFFMQADDMLMAADYQEEYMQQFSNRLCLYWKCLCGRGSESERKVSMKAVKKDLVKFLVSAGVFLGAGALIMKYKRWSVVKKVRKGKMSPMQEGDVQLAVDRIKNMGANTPGQMIDLKNEGWLSIEKIGLIKEEHERNLGYALGLYLVTEKDTIELQAFSGLQHILQHFDAIQDLRAISVFIISTTSAAQDVRYQGVWNRRNKKWEYKQYLMNRKTKEWEFQLPRK